MSRLVKMISAWLFQIFTSNILFVLSQPDSEWSFCPANILAFREVLALIFATSPVVYAIFCLTIDRILYKVGVPTHLSCYLGGGGEGKRAAS